MAERCPKHDVALSPEGRCVLCARSSRPPVPLEASEKRSLGSQILNGLMLSAVAASLGLLSLWWTNPGALDAIIGKQGPAVAITAEPTAGSARRPPRGVAKAQDAHQDTQRPEADLAPQLQGEPQPMLTSEPAGAAVDPAADDKRDAKRSAMVAKQIRDRELAAARGGVRVEMFGTRWCGVCKRARAFMAQEGIAYIEHDVDDDPAASRRMRELNPRGGVPTFDIEGEVLVGFEGRAMLAAIERAAKR